jgi:hypothetical protein
LIQSISPGEFNEINQDINDDYGIVYYRVIL